MTRSPSQRSALRAPKGHGDSTSFDMNGYGSTCTVLRATEAEEEADPAMEEECSGVGEAEPGVGEAEKCG